mmetsp:Transcript_6690/g.6015  ORF Transcript_6690/g.6015 Transcript_6690/m.6015 type:complete len:84 (+) Transcript_6690:372-623(+)
MKYEKAIDLIGMLYRLSQRNVASLSGKEHNERRKILSAAFHFEYLKTVFSKISYIAKDRYDEMEQKQGLKNVEIIRPFTFIPG